MIGQWFFYFSLMLASVVTITLASGIIISALGQEVKRAIDHYWVGFDERFADDDPDSVRDSLLEIKSSGKVC